MRTNGRYGRSGRTGRDTSGVARWRGTGLGGGVVYPSPEFEGWGGSRVLTDQSRLVNGTWYVAECDSAKPWSISQHAVYDQWRFEVRSGDQWASDGGGVNRAELDGYTNEFPKSVALWGAGAFLIEGGPAGNPDSFIGQLHQTAEAGYTSLNPPFAFHLLGTTFHIRTRTDNGTPPAGDPSGVSRYSFTPDRDRWYRYVFKITIDPAGSGGLEVWIDGTKVVNLGSGLATGYNAVGNYWKFGVYRTAETVPFAIRFANVEFGTADLTARIASPKALNTPKAIVPARAFDGMGATAMWSTARLLANNFNGYPALFVNDKVSSFRDQVASKHLAQATAASRPAVSAVNGWLAADFDGTDDIMSASIALSNFVAAGDGYGLWGVYPDAITSNVANIYSNHCIFGDSGDFAGLFLKSGATAASYAFDGAVKTPTGVAITASAPHTVEFRLTGGNLGVRVDGGAWSTVASGNITTLTGTFNVGGNVNAAATQAFNGKIVEGGMWSTTPSTAIQDAARAFVASLIGSS